MSVSFEPLTSNTVETYINVGVASYNEHYLHLWVNEDASSFLNENLSLSAVKNALKDPNQKLFIVRKDEQAIGIVKLTVNSDKGNHLSKNNVLLNKIYLLKSHAGQGIGKIALDFVSAWAKKQNKDLIWLYAMKKGKALKFYLKHGYEFIQETSLELPNAKESEKGMWILAKNL